MAASKKTFPFSRLRSSRSRKNGSTDCRKPYSKSSLENNSSLRNRIYPAYFTVDDLALYRRKKLPDRIQRDNLRPLSGKFAHLKSEYKRKFKSFILAADESVKSWRNKHLEDKQSAHQKDNQDNLDTSSSKSSESEIELEKPSLSSEQQEPLPMFKEIKRAAPVRRPTTLKIEGQFTDATENKDQFKEPQITRRPALFRRGTTLKLEGEMDLSTEANDKFKIYENIDSHRGTLLRRSTNLDLASGSIDSLTEYDSSYVTPEMTERTPLARSMENLHIEGEITFDPEYKRNYIDYHTNYPDIIFKGRKMDTRPTYPTNESNLLKYCQIKDILSDKNLKPDFNPEYRRAYVPLKLTEKSNFKRPRTHLTPAFGIGEKESELNAKYKPFENIQKVKNVRPSTNLHAEGKTQFMPEYKSAFINFADQQQTQSFSVLEADRKNRSADIRFKKGKRLPLLIKDDSGVFDSKFTASHKPSFRLQVTNPDHVYKPFEKNRNEDTSFLVLDENNNRRNNNWARNKQNQRWSPSWTKY